VTLVGVGLLAIGGLTLWRSVRAGGPFRDGPWPGLSPAGAMVLLGCALLLAGGQLAIGDPRTPVPDLPLVAVLAVGPLALATRLVGAPGVAAAVCGAYLLPRTVLSLVDPSIEPPMLLLVPALAFDASAWLRWADVKLVWPGGRSAWRRRRVGVTPGVTLSALHVTPGVTPRFYAGGGRRGAVGPGSVGRARAVVAGGVFGAVLCAVEPPFAQLLGGDPAVWSGPSLWLAGGLATVACAFAALAVSAQGTAA